MGHLATVQALLPFFFFAFVLDLLRPVIGLENSRHSLNQSDAELKPIKTWAV